jgi:hypothetical protein
LTVRGRCISGRQFLAYPWNQRGIRGFSYEVFPDNAELSLGELGRMLFLLVNLRYSDMSQPGWLHGLILEMIGGGMTRRRGVCRVRVPGYSFDDYGVFGGVGRGMVRII